MPQPRPPEEDRWPVVDEAGYADELDQPDVPRLGGSRRWWLVGVLLAVPAVALLAWIGVRNATGVITPRVTGYQVVDDRTVTVDFDVDRPVGWTVRCEARALDVRFGTVGSVQVTVPATDGQVTKAHARLRTTSRAVTGTVKTCTRV